MRNTIVLRDAELDFALQYTQGSLVRRATSDVAPFCAGHRLAVQERLFQSDCGQYLAQVAGGDLALYDVISIDGKRRWFYRRQGSPARVYCWENRYTHYHAERPTPGFLISFADLIDGKLCDKREAEFHRRVPGNRMPQWARRLAITVTACERMPLITAWDRKVPGIRQSVAELGKHDQNEAIWLITYDRLSLLDHYETHKIAERETA